MVKPNLANCRLPTSSDSAATRPAGCYYVRQLMSPTDALAIFIPRFEQYAQRTDNRLDALEEDSEEFKDMASVLRTEWAMTRETNKHLTRAIVGVGFLLIGAAVSIVVFGPGA